MKALVTYDITADAARLRLASSLQHIGVRLQRSVFLIEASHLDLERLVAKAGVDLNWSTDSLLIQPTCQSCEQGRRMLGRDDSIVFAQPYWVL